MTVSATVGSPLAGCRVLVTRARAQATALTERLEQLGATVVALPTVAIVPADPRPLDEAIRHVTTYDWIVFTSANGVDAFADRLNAIGADDSIMARPTIGAIGRATAERLRERGFRVDFVPERFVAESVVEGMRALGVSGQRVLLPVADVARDTLQDGLRQAGAIVDVVDAYRTELPDDFDVGAVGILLDGVDVVTFASPSSVRNALALAGGRLPAMRAVCIGPVTADAAREAGLTVAGVAEEFTISGLVEAVVRLVERDEKGVPDGDHA